MGFIADCQAAGIPSSLLVPIRPWNRPDRDGNGAGKAPAIPRQTDRADPIWLSMLNWRKGATSAELQFADTFGANAGLMLGCPDAPQNPQWNFVSVDIDFEEDGQVHRDRFVNAVSRVWPTLVLRETVPHRALLLLRMRDANAIGRKTVYKIYFTEQTGKNPKEKLVGKIEVLTTGQQAVIAGIHRSGAPIKWRICVDTEWGDETFHSPPVKQGKVPVFATFHDIINDIRGVLDNLSHSGYSYESRTGGAGEIIPDGDLAPDYLTPQILSDLVDRMYNGPDIDRETYVDTMMAIAASRAGIIVHHGALSAGEETLIAISAAKWAEKWWPSSIKALDAELGKWQNDWASRTSGFHTSWHRLCDLAFKLGVPTAKAEDAKYEFTADDDPFVMLPVDPDTLPVNTVKIGEVPISMDEARQSDIYVADYIRHERSMARLSCYVPEFKRWMLWDEINGWNGTSDARACVAETIQQELKAYVNKFGSPESGWTRGDRNAMLSNRKIRNVMDVLADMVHIKTEAMDQAPCFLQTSVGTYSLRDLKVIPHHKRWELHDTRITKVIPNEGDTPLFDALLRVLADGDQESVEWMLHYFGYSLIGAPKAQCFLVLWGPGGNGKGTLAEVLRYVLGSYSVPLENKVLLESGKNMHKTELNLIRGKRLAVVAEMPRDEKWNESILKQLTGDDEIHARDMHKDASFFKPEAALLICCNEVPRFASVGPAVQRRFRMVGTLQRPQKVDPNYAKKVITQEAGAILWKLMRYAQAVIRNDMQLPEVPSKMKQETESTLAESDQIFGWMEAECDQCSPKDGDDIEELRKRYEAWLQRNAKDEDGFTFDKVTKKEFLAILKSKGIRMTDNNGTPMRKRKMVNGIPVDVNVCGLKLKIRAVA